MTSFEKIESILSRGISLHDMGVNNWALYKEQALLVLEELEGQKLSVLGGDVYELINGLIEPNYDNWYCNKIENEPLTNFVQRSASRAYQYISGYCTESGREPLFVLVVE